MRPFCCVIVEPPCATRPSRQLVTNARRIAPGSTPGLVQDARSSMAIVACWRTGGTSSRLTRSRRCSSNVERSLPSRSRTNVE